MKRKILQASLLAGFLSLWQLNVVAAGESPAFRSVVVQQDPKQWGFEIIGAGLASVRQPQPVQLEFWSAAGALTVTNASYDSFKKAGDSYVGKAVVVGPGDSRFTFEDHWGRAGSVFRLIRKVKVQGNAPGGFLSGCALDFAKPLSWSEAEWFVPGMIYGGFANLTETAIGAKAYYQPGNFSVRIREDRLPAPLMLAHWGDGTSLAVLNPAPRGDTTAADSLDTKAVPMTDERFQFGAIGGQELSGKLSVGYWFPGSEGEVTYAGDTYPGGQMHTWRRRFHPIKDGLVQRYEMALRFGRDEDFPASYRAAWRWAWKTLKPQVTPQDIPAARRYLVDAMSTCVVEREGHTGIFNCVDAVTKDFAHADQKSVMGFTGKSLEAANFFLQEAAIEPGPRSEHLLLQGEAIIASFLKLRMSPPQAEGFSFTDGRPVCAIGDQVFLRSFGDDIKALLKAYQRETKLGRAHPEWLNWCREFADWLLTQQQPAGGFPRTWKSVNGEVVSASPNSSFNAVPLLVLLSQITGQAKYLEAACRAAEFCWSNGQFRGAFVGGTIDNPDVLDKEAATLSLEAYLHLYDATKEVKWLCRARAAADYAETWIYIWNVPMPADADNSQLHWKRGVPTVGLQLISTGHSLVDDYMAFDTDEYAKLWKYTADAHYREVSCILLHNTKNMLAVPGRLYDLGTPGWQQEHWSLAPRRGQGLHRGWLPWVTTSHLNGIFGLMELDPAMVSQLSGPASAPPSDSVR